MPDTGPPWNIPYPLGSDPADDPSQSHARAQKTHDGLNIQSAVLAGTQRHGVLGWSTPVDAVQTATAIAGGRFYAVRVPIAVPATVTAIQMNIGVAGAGLVAGQTLVGLYDPPTGALLGQVADQSVAWTSVGLKDMPLLMAANLPAGDVWAAWICNGTTMPSLARSASQSVQLTNLNLTLANSRSVLGPALTALPAFMPTVTAQPPIWFVALR